MADQPGTPRTITVTTADSVVLGGTVYEPTARNQRVVLLNSAMAVRQKFYAQYATYLASRGFTVVTYDYRGIGTSRPASLRGYQANLWEWGVKDLHAMIGWVRDHYPSMKLLSVGHSVGGQVLGLTPENRHISAFLGVAVQSAHWRFWSGLPRLRMLFYWYCLFPLVPRLLGYFPGRLGIGEDLPAGVMLDWAHGARRRKYLLDLFPEHNHFASFTGAFYDYSFSDDDFAPRAAVEELLTFYPNARKTHKHVRPSDLSLTSIGHFGFFRDRSEPWLWAESTDWLLGQ